MKKNGTRLLSLLLVLTMVLSFAPTAFAAEPEVAAPAEEESYDSSWGDWEDWEETDPAAAPAEEEQPEEPAVEPVEEIVAEEEPALVEEPVAVEEPVEVAYPANTFFYVGGSGLRVTVDAPEGAFPADAQMSVTEVRPDAVQGVVANAGVSGDVLIAADISFYDANGTELQPEEDVEVSVTAALPKAKDLKVVHIGDDNNVEEVNQLPEGGEGYTASVQNASDARTLRFAAKSFSIYAVVAGSTEENARATVNFKNGSKTIATVYVKNSDTADELKTIVYDPGAGELGEKQLFRGWTTVENYDMNTPVMNIDEVRTYLKDLAITEGMEVNIYAVIYKVYTVSFLDANNVSLGSEDVLLLNSATTAPYTIKTTYNPTSQTQNFEGWNVKEGASLISNAKFEGEDQAAPYPVKTTMDIAGDVIFSVNVANGHWLIFDEVKKGATYNAPVFVHENEVTSESMARLPMKLRGYTFDGWYTGEPETEGGDPTGEKFVFGSTLNDKTTLYAKWIQATEADYTIIIWKQRVTDDKNAADADKNYDVWEAVTGHGTVGQNVPGVAQNGASVNTGFSNPAQTNNVRITANGTTKEYAQTGFHCDRFDTNVKIKPEGDTVLNVYYDRNLITVNFNPGSYYILDENTGNYSTNTVTYTGLFDSALTFKWPTQCRDYNYWGGYDTYNILWYYGQTVLTFIGSFKLPTASNTSITLSITNTGNVPVRFFKQDDEGNWPANANGADLVIYTSGGDFTFTEKYTGFSVDTYRTSNYTTGTSGWSNCKNGNSYNTCSSGYNQLNIRYTRNKYSIKFLDGTYYDGNGNIVKAASKTPLKTTEDIYYEKDISSYNKNGANYYVPTAPDGYVFAGWYIDQVCNKPYSFDKMPEGGITVYAKWVLKQYRIFLHPNATLPDGTNDDCLDWGAESNLTFRVSYGEKGSFTSPRREQTAYDFIGWYTDEACTIPFNVDTKMTDDTVTTAYDKTKDFTDPMNKFGEGATWNSDVQDEAGNPRDRFWITRKLDLYGKWSARLVGAEGITVVYDANGGSNAPTDSLKYKDNVDAVAGAASTPASEDDQFLYWVQQKWDGSKFVDIEGSKIYPGQTFRVLKSNSKVEDLPVEQQSPGVTKKYTVQLRAEYGPLEPGTPTHITWYANGGVNNKTIADVEKEIVNGNTTLGYVSLQINEKIPIPAPATFTRTGFTFVGWARLTEPDGAFADGQVVESKFTEVKDPELWLKLNDDGTTFSELDGSGNVIAGHNNITEVAADERLDYHALYAVWQCNFKVYHSGVAGGNIETFTISDLKADGTFDLTGTALTANTLYGGYYLEGGFTAPAVGEDGKPTDACAAYDGYNWKWSKPETVAGKAITPVDGTTYYIKEVPAAKFLRPYTHFTFYIKNSDIGSLFMISDLDDLNYSGTGFIVTDKNNNAKVYKTLKIKATNTGDTATITPSSAFGKRGVTDESYLTCLDVTGLVEGKQIKEYWITPDGATVTGIVTRTLTGTSNKNTIKAASETVGSEISFG